MTSDGQAVIQRKNKFTLRCGILYLKWTLKGDAAESLLLVVPWLLRVAALNGCHQEAGHQASKRSISLAEE